MRRISFCFNDFFYFSYIVNIYEFCFIFVQPLVCYICTLWIYLSVFVVFLLCFDYIYIVYTMDFKQAFCSFGAVVDGLGSWRWWRWRGTIRKCIGPWWCGGREWWESGSAVGPCSCFWYFQYIRYFYCLYLIFILCLRIILYCFLYLCFIAIFSLYTYCYILSFISLHFCCNKAVFICFVGIIYTWFYSLFVSLCFWYYLSLFCIIYDFCGCW